MSFRNELDAITEAARRNGSCDDPIIRQRIADAWMGLEIQRANALRTLSSEAELEPAAMIHKLFWATWHRDLGKLAMDVLGADSEIAAEELADAGVYALTALQRLFLFTRSDTLYGGTNEIQRNQIAERALGLPREPRPA